MTFDEIQATLQNLKTSRVKVSEKENKKSDKNIHSLDIIKQETILHDSSMALQSLNEDLNFPSSPSMPNSLTCVSATDDKFENERQRLIDTLTGSPPPPPLPSLPSSSSSSATSLSPSLQLKVKRSRKQQLVLVNRDDGEITFQPAALLQNEEKVIGKRRGKRRGPSSQMRRGFMDVKGMKRTRQREVCIRYTETISKLSASLMILIFKFVNFLYVVKSLVKAMKVKKDQFAPFCYNLSKLM